VRSLSVTHEEALASFRARWSHPPVDVWAAQQLIPEGWLVQEQVVDHLSTAVRVFQPLGDGKWLSSYAHSLDDVLVQVEKLMTKRQPRRVREVEEQKVYNPYIDYFKEHPYAYQGGQRNGGVPPAYHCKVLLDVPYDHGKPSFKAECCNPHCDGFVINRYAAPWCTECNEAVPNEWKGWFWKLQTAKALKRLIKDVFA